MSDNARETVRNTSIFSLFTIFSRFLGLARDMLKAYAFGTGMFSVAFDVAFRLPNMLRNLVAEGALSQAFIPIYETYRHKGRMEAAQAAGTVLRFITLLLSAITFLAIVITPWLLPYIIGAANAERTALTISLTQLLFPYIILMSVASIYMAIQYSHNLFWAPSMGPALLNLVILVFFGGWLLAVPYLPAHWQDGKTLIYVFSVVTLIAAIVQVIFQALTTRHAGLSPNWGAPKRHPALKSLFTMMLPALFGAAVQEIGQIIDIYLAMLIENRVAGAVSALTYSHRLIQLPIGIFGVALATAALPQLSRLFVEEKNREFDESLLLSVRLNIFLIVPAISGLVILAEPIVGFIFERGEFNRESTQITAFALQFYALGILAYSLQKLFTSSLYARRNTKTPALIAAAVLVLNVLLSVIFMRFLNHGGLALGSACAAYIGIFIYIKKFRHYGFLKLSLTDLKNFLPLLLANLLLASGLYLLAQKIKNFSYAIQLGIAIPAALLFYFPVSALLKLPEFFLFKEIAVKIKNRLTR